MDSEGKKDIAGFVSQVNEQTENGWFMAVRVMVSSSL